MGLQVGLVGLPNVGKSTLFNAVSQAGAAAENFPFCTIEPNVGVVPMPDDRLDVVARLMGSPEAIPTTIEFVDIAGLVSGASQGEGLGNQFLAHIREVDAICHVVRGFEDDDVAHLAGEVDPVRDIQVVETELVLKDLETTERRLERTARSARAGEKDAREDAETLQRLHDHLAAGEPARDFPRADRREARLVSELFLLTDRPVLYAANVGEEDLPDGGRPVDAIRQFLKAGDRGDDAAVVVVCAQVEAELTDLPADERRAYLETLGLERSGLERFVQAAYDLLGLLTFFTANEKEARAWTVAAGATAQEAAGQIHTDMQRGFIRAEVMSYDDLVEYGSEAAVRDAGRLRIEGKDYRVRDGDVMFVRFNV